MSQCLPVQQTPDKVAIVLAETTTVLALPCEEQMSRQWSVAPSPITMTFCNGMCNVLPYQQHLISLWKCVWKSWRQPTWIIFSPMVSSLALSCRSMENMLSNGLKLSAFVMHMTDVSLKWCASTNASWSCCLLLAGNQFNQTKSVWPHRIQWHLKSPSVQELNLLCLWACAKKPCAAFWLQLQAPSHKSLLLWENKRWWEWQVPEGWIWKTLTSSRLSSEREQMCVTTKQNHCCTIDKSAIWLGVTTQNIRQRAHCDKNGTAQWLLAEIPSTDSNSGTSQLVPIPFSVWPLLLSSEPAFCSSWATTSTTLAPWQLEEHPKAIRPDCDEILNNELANKWSLMMICQSKWQALTRPKNDQREWKRLRTAATTQSKVSCKLMTQGHLIVATTDNWETQQSLLTMLKSTQKTVMNRRLTELGESLTGETTPHAALMPWFQVTVQMCWASIGHVCDCAVCYS